MILFKVRKSNDGHGFLLDMKVSDLFGVLQTVGSAVPLSDLQSDDGYRIRISSDGVIEIGYENDHWNLK